MLCYMCIVLYCIVLCCVVFYNNIFCDGNFKYIDIAFFNTV